MVVVLEAPDGTDFTLKNLSQSDSTDNITQTFTVEASRVAANGTWQLWVRDTYANDTGYIDSWGPKLSDPRQLTAPRSDPKAAAQPGCGLYPFRCRRRRVRVPLLREYLLATPVR
ncbi:proprotein convertase P-domain-containing protein [Streptomyces microflavus]|uniref:proprotein convertase P-domain-containing protein n=1 Tax=Streptomyces microflavus TaxID=1919 RepID=UPI0036BB6186